MKGFTHVAGEAPRAMSKGPHEKAPPFSIGAILAAEVLKHLPVESRYKKPLRMPPPSSALPHFSMRWAMVYGGHHAAADPHLSRLVSSPYDDSHP